MGRPPKGTGMAFVPRDQVKQRTAFGRFNGRLDPAEGIAPSDRRYRAALMQHRFALAVHDFLSFRETSIAAVLAAADDHAGLSEDRVRRVLRGETGAQLADLVFWADQSRLVALALAQYFQDWKVPDAGSGTGSTPSQPTSHLQAIQPKTLHRSR